MTSNVIKLFNELFEWLLSEEERRRSDSPALAPSLFCAKEHMEDGFVSTYTDIVYPAGVVQRRRT